MQTEKKPAAEIAPPSNATAHLWRRLPTIVKVILMVPLVMVLLGAEIELRLAPRLDVILTAAGVWAMWAWLVGRPLAAM
jgi:hypothetical protein